MHEHARAAIAKASRDRPDVDYPVGSRRWHVGCVSDRSPAGEPMSTFNDPFASDRRLDRRGCSCGGHGSQAEHERASAAIVDREESRYGRVVEGAMMRALFPEDATRRSFLSAVGASTALAALSQILPIGAATEAFAQGTGALEKKELKVGFIPITCATPIIMAAPAGLLRRSRSLDGGGGQDGRVGRDPRQDDQQGIRRRAHAGPDAASLSRSAIGSNPVPLTPCRRSRTSTARRSRSR